MLRYFILLFHIVPSCIVIPPYVRVYIAVSYKTALVEIENIIYGLQMDQETAEGYYFKKVKLNSGSSYNGFTTILEAEELINRKFLVKGAFNLISE